MPARSWSVAVPVLALILSGCGFLPSPPASEPAPTSTSASEDPRCDLLLDEDRVRDVWDAPLRPSEPLEFGASGSWAMQGTALVQVGALLCSWSLPDESGGLSIIAMGDAADGHRRSEASFLAAPFSYRPMEVADSAATLCRSDDRIRCHWNVLAGDTWLSVFATGLDPADAASDEKTSSPAVPDLVASIVRALDQVELEAPPETVPDVPACFDSISAEEAGAALGVDPSELGLASDRSVERSLGRSTPEFGQVMWAYAFEVLGWTECAIVDQQGSLATVMAAPDAAWVIEDADADQPSPVAIPEWGPGIETCVTEGAFTACTVAVTVGDDLLLVQLPTDNPEVGLSAASALVSAASG